MMVLIWNKNETVRKELLATFEELYIMLPGSGGKTRQSPEAVAKNLVTLVCGADLGELTC